MREKLSEIRPYQKTVDPDAEMLYPKGSYYWLPMTRHQAKHERELMASELEQWLRNFRSKSARPSDKKYFQMLSYRLYELEGLIMAGKTPKAKPAQGNSAFKGFLQRPLTDDELVLCAQSKVKPVAIFERMNALVLNGFKLSLNTTKDGGSIASWTDILEGRVSYGYCLSTWGEDPYEALMLSIYKHDEVLKGDWAELIGRSSARKRG